MLGRTDSRGRLLLLLVALVLLSGGMTARLAYWQVNQPRAADGAGRGRPSYDAASPFRPSGGRSTTGPARSCWPRRSTAYRIVADLHGLPAGRAQARRRRAGRLPGPRRGRRGGPAEGDAERRLLRAPGHATSTRTPPARSPTRRRPAPWRRSRSSRRRCASTRRPAARRTPRWPPRCSASSTPAVRASTAWSSSTTPCSRAGRR